LPKAREIHRLCDRILGKLVTMGNKPEAWVLQKSKMPLPLTH